jgi:CBS domain containing-hemolysin-like protein
VLLFGLLTLRAALTFAHAALTNIRQTSLREQAGNGSSLAAQALRLLDSEARLSIAYMLWCTLLNFLIAAVIAEQFVFPLLNDQYPDNALPGYLLVLVAGMLTVVLGEIVPEGLGSARSEPLLPIVVPFLGLLLVLSAPLTALLLGLSRGIAGIFGSGDMVDRVTEAEIMTLVNAGHTGGTIEEEEKDMIYSVLQLNETRVRELMTPRMDIRALEVNTPLKDALENFILSGFSRIPVYEENIDNIVGLLYAKDLLALWHNDTMQTLLTRDMVRPAYFVPETKRADELLREMQNRNIHLAIVVDEYGGTAGLVTIENLIEEIVGDIRDEFDLNEEVDYIQSGEGEYLIDGTMNIDDVNELLGVHLNNDDSDTLAGYIYTRLGRVPLLDETLETAETILRVRSLDGRRIRKIQVTLKAPVSPGEALPAPDEAASPGKPALPKPPDTLAADNL